MDQVRRKVDAERTMARANSRARAGYQLSQSRAAKLEAEVKRLREENQAMKRRMEELSRALHELKQQKPRSEGIRQLEERKVQVAMDLIRMRGVYRSAHPALQARKKEMEDLNKVIEEMNRTRPHGNSSFER